MLDIRIISDQQNSVLDAVVDIKNCTVKEVALAVAVLVNETGLLKELGATKTAETLAEGMAISEHLDSFRNGEKIEIMN